MYLTGSSLSLTERALAAMLAVLIPASVALALIVVWPVLQRDGEGGEALTIFNVQSQAENTRAEKADNNLEKRSKDESRVPEQARVAASVPPKIPVAPNRFFIENKVVPVEELVEPAPAKSSNSEPNSANTGAAASPAALLPMTDAEAAAGGQNSGSTSARDEYGGMVFARIRAAQRYERVLARDGISGTVMVAFTINRRGHLREERIAQTSGSQVLDRLALGHLAQAAPFPRPPNGMSRNFIIPLTYRQGD